MLLALAVLAALVALGAAAESNELLVHVTAPYRTSRAIETGEFIADALPNGDREPAFWAYVEARDKANLSLSSTDAQQLEISLLAGEFVLRTESLAKLSERLRDALGFNGCPAGQAWAAVELSDGILATCDPKELSRTSSASNLPESCSAIPAGKLEVTPMDHVYPFGRTIDGKNKLRTMIVHGDLESDSFFTLWESAQAAAKEDVSVNLILRPEPSPERQKDRPRFGGFSVDLDIKNTEYVAVDRTSFANKKSGPGKSDEDSSLESGIYFSTLLEQVKDDPEAITKLNAFRVNLKQSREKLKAWEVADVSIQIALDSLAAKDPLMHFKDIVENLPTNARRLARIEVPDDVREAIQKRGRRDTKVWVNGVPVSVQGDFGALLKQIRQLARLGALGSRSGIPKLDFMRWLQPQDSRIGWGSRLDVRKFAKGAVAFLNDIEKDKAYAGLSSSLDALRKAPKSVNQLVPVRRNLYTAIFVIDPSDATQVETLGVLRYFVRMGAPVRFGIVLAGSALAETLAAETGKEVKLPETGATPCTTDEDCSSPRCLARLFVTARKNYGLDAALSVLMELAVHLRDRQASCAEVSDVFANTIAHETNAWSSGKFRTVAANALQGGKTDLVLEAEQGVLKMARYSGALGLIAPSMTFNGRVYDLKNSKARIDRLIQAVLFEEQSLIQAAAETLVDEEDILGQIMRLAGASQRNSRVVNIPLSEMRFLTLNQQDIAKANALYVSANENARVTVWAVRGSKFCKEALEALQAVLARDDVRIGILLGESTKTFGSTATLEELKNECGGISTGPLPFGLSPSTWFVANARVVEGPENGVPSEGDALVLIDMERTRVSHLPSTLSADNVFISAGLLGLFQQARERASSDGLASIPDQDEKTVNTDRFSWREQNRNLTEDWTAFEVHLDADPLASATPSAVAFAAWMRSTLGASVKMRLYPRSDIGQLPPSSFHRWAPNGVARFEGLPADQLLTLKVDVPRSWIVYAGDFGKRDPDNLMMSDGNLTAWYELTHVLVDGQASDTETGEPAAGMQIELIEADGLVSLQEPVRRAADSIVMYNLGYWQLKARPGVFRVRPIHSYALVKPAEPYRAVAVKDFVGTGSIELKVTKDASKVPSSLSREQDDAADDTMHVFSLASGALYERFLRIMMLSVRKRSSGKIKFWLLENYMSAKMKKFLPAFAEKNDFSYELVTFKWPDWLRGQSERQRQIWGMKILFLDVLFPLNVKRIIYVDSDQVLRADLRELWNMDLRGAPYAMTPFCDSRKETLGFQFWRQGYWVNHLRGKSYHISALFVVDLERFRENSVGDRLRATYQQLSADPNSLANLDQDLPNFAQHDIPIFSLPQEWLWCESWCSDASKRKAKTIDLCNNPLHKEPKLEMAKRVIQGELFNESWEELDRMVGWPEPLE